MKNVLITGVAGYLGGVLARKIAREPGVERIVGIDVREPAVDLPGLVFLRRDITEPFGDVFRDYAIDTALHLAFIVAPIRDEARAHHINLQGSRNFLNAAAEAGTEQVFYLGSHLEYGAYAGNPPLFTEDMPLRPGADYPYAADKAEVDLMFREFAACHPETVVTIGRTVAVAGPGAGASGLNILFMPVMVKVWGSNPAWQFVHEDDLAEWITLLVRGRHAGVFNLAGDGHVLYRDMIRALGKPSVSLPSWLLSHAIRFAWRLRLQSKGQAGGVAMIKHSILLSNDKVKQATGYQAACTSEHGFLEYIRGRTAKRKLK